MSVSTAVPNGYTVLYGTWNAFSGSTALGIGSAVAVITDSSNNTYVRTSTGGQIEYDLANVTTGGSSIARIRAGAIVKNGDGNAASMYIDSTIGGLTWYGYPSTSTASTVYSGWVADRSAISTAVANAAVAGFISYSTALRYTKLWMEYDLTSTPAGTPAASSNVTDRPAITWTFSDADGLVQASAVVKVFSSAQYSAGGFDAATSTPLWSGTVNGTAATITPATAIVTNGTKYKPFLQVYKNVSSYTNIPSAWTSATSVTTATFTVPNAPTATATWSTALSRVQITTVGSATPYRIVIFRGTSLDDPNYTVLKDSRSSDGTSTAYDYYMPRGTQVVYGAWVNSGTQTPYLSSTATLSTVTTTTASAWELRSVDDPATYYNLSTPVTGISFDIYEGQTVFRPLGSDRPVVAAGDIGGDDGTMQITTTNQTTWDNIKTMLELQSDLYLVAPFVDSTNLSRRWFVRVTGRSWTESGIPSAQVRIAQVSFVEVQAPEVAAE